MESDTHVIIPFSTNSYLQLPNEHDPRTMVAMFAKAEGDIEMTLQLKR